jgi:hypothetical protein
MLNTNLSESVSHLRKRVFEICQSQKIEGWIPAEDVKQIVFGLPNSTLDMSGGFTVIDDQDTNGDDEPKKVTVGQVGLKEYSVLAFKVMTDTRTAPDDEFDVTLPEMDQEPEVPAC